MIYNYSDRKSALNAVKKNGGIELLNVCGSLQYDKEFLLESLKLDVTSLQHMNYSLRNEKEFLLKAIDIDVTSIQYASYELRSDKRFILQAVKLDGRVLEYISQSLRNDKEVVLKAVKQNGRTLRFSSEEFRGDKEMVMEAVKQNGSSLEFASEELKNDKEFVLEAVKQDVSSLQYTGKELKNDKVFLLEAVVLDGSSLKYAKLGSLKDDKDFLLEAVKVNGNSLKFASQELQNDRELLHFATISKKKEHPLKSPSEERLFWDLEEFQKSRISVPRLALKKMIDSFIKRSDIEFELERWMFCSLDLLISLQLSKYLEGIKIKEMIMSKLKRVLEQLLKKHSQDQSGAVKRRLLPHISRYSWMDSQLFDEPDIFSNEWSDQEKMKSVVADRIRIHLSEVLSNEGDYSSEDHLLKQNVEKIRSLIYEKFQDIGQKVSDSNSFSFVDLHEDTKRELLNLLKIIATPQFLASTRFEEDLMCLELGNSLKFFGFVDENNTISRYYGFGLVFVEFLGGGVFGRSVKCRRLFYGTFDSKGLWHGEKCKEYSPKDGTLVFEGGFKNGQREGKGIEYNLDKTTGVPVQVFEGKYRNGKRNGRGESFEKGEIIRGTWRSGVLDESTVFKYECPIFKYKDVKKHLNDSNQIGRGAFGVIYKVKRSIFRGLGNKNVEEKSVAVKILEQPVNEHEAHITRRMIRRGIGYCYSVKSKHILEDLV